MPDWKPEIIKPLWRLPFDRAWPMAVAWLGIQRRVAAGNQDGDLLIWDLPEQATPAKIKDESGKEVDGFADPPPARRLVGHTNGITRLVASPDGHTLVSASLDRSLRIWDTRAAATGTSELVLDQRKRERKARGQSSEKKQAILAAPGVTIPTQESAATLAGHRDWILALGISRDGKRVISGDDAGQVIVWELAGRKEVARWQCPGVAWVVAAALSPDGQTALVSQYRRKGGDYNNYPAGLRIYNVADGHMKLDLLATMFPKEKNPPYQYQYEYGKFVGNGLVAAAFSPDGKLLALGQGGEEGDGKTHLVDVASGKLVRTVLGHQYGVTDAAFSNDGKYLLTVGRDTTLRVIGVEDGQEKAKLGKPRGGQFTDWLSALSLSLDERWLAASDISGLVQVWQVTG